ncbi:MAG TPA: ATP-binding protein [Thermosynechococcaceae cyanobacterium]
MPIDRASSVPRLLPLAAFIHLSNVLEQTARSASEQALVLTDHHLPELVWSDRGDRFVLVVSAQFSGLLLGEATDIEEYRVRLSYSPETIANFITQLITQLSAQVEDGAKVMALQQAVRQLQPNDAIVQSEFVLELVEVLTTTLPIVPSASNISCDLVVADALQQQVKQERLLNQVTTQIRQSMELPEILETAVRQLRPILQADRLVIYEFTPSVVNSLLLTSTNQASGPTRPREAGSGQTRSGQAKSGQASSGQISYEARVRDEISSVLHLTESTNWFSEVPDCREKYRKGSTLAIDDCEVTYAHHPCLLNLMRQAQVRAKLIAPIVVDEQLWGLLIAHQCLEPRPWKDPEKTFVRHVAEHLSIAIQQAKLYAQVQQQAQTLERRVIDRTQELRDALTAVQSASLAKSEFLATMSHELRTPLTCIIGMTATLLRLPTGQAGEKFLPLEKQRDYLKTIQRSGEHLLELINDILDISQAEAGKMMLEVSEFSLAQTAQETFSILKDKAVQAEIDLKLELHLEKENDRFTADPRRVRQILLNLLNNAVKFTPAGGQVTLRVWREAENVVLQVQDTGIGIPESQRSLLFQKFQQLDSTYHRRYEGTGLGLALTKQMIDLHGGSIVVDSRESQGSSFTVSLPAQELSSSRSSLPAPVPPRSAQGRIVLIDDQELTSPTVCDLLTTAGHHVIWMSNELAAIHQVEVLQPHAVVFSTRSSLNATDLLRRMYQNPATRSLPVVVVSPESLDLPSLELPEPFLVSIDQPEQLLAQIANFV